MEPSRLTCTCSYLSFSIIHLLLYHQLVSTQRRSVDLRGDRAHVALHDVRDHLVRCETPRERRRLVLVCELDDAFRDLCPVAIKLPELELVPDHAMAEAHAEIRVELPHAWAPLDAKDHLFDEACLGIRDLVDKDEARAACIGLERVGDKIGRACLERRRMHRRQDLVKAVVHNGNIVVAHRGREEGLGQALHPCFELVCKAQTTAVQTKTSFR